MRCPDPLPSELTDCIAGFAKAWAASAARPKVSDVTRRGWTELLDAWVADEELPLLIRRGSAGRGRILKHDSGRDLVPTDNSPADWAFSLALDGEVPTVRDLRDWFISDLIPIAMVLTREEKQAARYRCTRQRVSLGTLGWKIAHVAEVGLGRVSLSTMALGLLQSHCRSFLDPRNMFLVPLQWSGLGEVPEVIAAVRAADAT
jgi:hypothetical protein